MRRVTSPGVVMPNQSMGDAFDQLKSLLGPPPSERLNADELRRIGRIPADVVVDGRDITAAMNDDHLAEVRQTQRRMIAALYWRAGVSEMMERMPLQSIHMEARHRGATHALFKAARAMEATCPR